MISPLLTQNLPLYMQQQPLAPPPVVGATPSPAIQVVQAPDESQRTEFQGPQVTTHVPTPETATAFQDLQDANKREAVAKAAQQPAERLAQQYEASAAETEADSARLAEVQRQEAVRQHQQKVAALSAEKEKRRQAEEAAAKPTSYWDDQGAPGRILAKFLVALSGIGGTVSGRGGNGAFETFQADEAKDRQAKLDKYTKSVEFRKMAEQDIEGAKVALSDEIAQITQNEISRANVLKKQVISFAKRSGLPNAMAKAQELAAKIDAENAERAVKLGQHWDQTVQGGRTTQSHTVNSTSKPGAPDLTALKDGKPYGIWRTPQEADKGREADAALSTLRGAADQLNAHIKQYGKLIDPTSKEYADRQAYGDAVSRELQTLQNAGVLNPGEYERNKKSVDTTLFKGGDAAVSANTIMVDGAGRKYDALLKSKAVRMDQPVPISQPQARAAAAPAKSKTPSADQAIELQQVDAKLRSLPLNDPARPRWEALRKRMAERGAHE